MSGTTTYDYTFTDNGQTDTVDITVEKTPTTVHNRYGIGTVVGEGQEVVGVSGTFEGGQIIGVVGNGAEVQQRTHHGYTQTYDNALFPSSASGAQNHVPGGPAFSGSMNGIDGYGVEVEVKFANGKTEDVNLYNLNGTFEAAVLGQGGHAITLDHTTYPCFCAGTRISTPTGYSNVEDLNPGDMVMTAEGAVVAVRWMGRRAVDLRFADPISSLPIRITAGALGDNLPERDLLVSPDHAMFLDGLLIQAGALVNGVSILRETKMAERFTYYHIETPDHSLVLAENAPTETFVDNVDRMAFDNWAEFEALADSRESVSEMDYPRVKAARQLPGAIRSKLAQFVTEEGKLHAA